ncbi:uncharacterized protein LOC141687033 [Apium graveolens]|uniref:uncharacterized protein LOC141687033 n=1 Tax=Apium graveolens TaxID=4045 RepID=UPI003D795C4A
MGKQRYNLRFFNLGKFQNSKYVGRKDGLIAGVEPDRFSYTVLMEHVKVDLKYSEIGGIYIKSDEAGGWKMVTSDKDLPLLDKDMDFYIDNIVDPKIEPLQQMQPHVIIRPRLNVFGAPKLVKQQFVTTHQLQQQNKIKRCNEVSGPRNSARLNNAEVMNPGEF